MASIKVTRYHKNFSDFCDFKPNDRKCKICENTAKSVLDILSVFEMMKLE